MVVTSAAINAHDIRNRLFREEMLKIPRVVRLRLKKEDWLRIEKEERLRIEREEMYWKRKGEEKKKTEPESHDREAATEGGKEQKIGRGNSDTEDFVEGIW